MTHPTTSVGENSTIWHGSPPSDTTGRSCAATVVDLQAMDFDGVLRVRRAKQAGSVAATEVLLRSPHALVPAIPPLVHNDVEVMKHFVETVMPSDEVWVAEVDSAIAGVLILSGNSIEHLHVDPDWFAQGLGFALLEWAKSGHPETLELWTFESNIGAQRFYERHAFGAVGRTTGDS